MVSNYVRNTARNACLFRYSHSTVWTGDIQRKVISKDSSFDAFSFRLSISQAGRRSMKAPCRCDIRRNQDKTQKNRLTDV